MNSRKAIYMDERGKVTITGDLSSSPHAVRGQRVSSGDVLACPKCTRPIYFGGRAVDYALSAGEAITVPCRCGNEVEVGPAGVVL